MGQMHVHWGRSTIDPLRADQLLIRLVGEGWRRLMKTLLEATLVVMVEKEVQCTRANVDL